MICMFMILSKPAIIWHGSIKVLLRSKMIRSFNLRSSCITFNISVPAFPTSLSPLPFGTCDIQADRNWLCKTWFSCSKLLLLSIWSRHHRVA
ncbi:hypothetical protein M758_3G244600 [Ceratodon purpureus]|nr:hypothetical protein M758_3G244600 [Ceratodon purpureus]